MIPLLVAVCVSLGVAAAGLLLAWGRAERRVDDAERELRRERARAERHRLTEAALAGHFATVPREQPTLRLPAIRPHTDAHAVTRHLAPVRPYRVATRKDRNL